jgi:hypothetical protein
MNQHRTIEQYWPAYLFPLDTSEAAIDGLCSIGETRLAAAIMRADEDSFAIKLSGGFDD